MINTYYKNTKNPFFDIVCKRLYEFFNALFKNPLCLSFINILTLHSINTKFLKNKIFDLVNPKHLDYNIIMFTHCVENFKLNNEHKPNMILNENINVLNLISDNNFSQGYQQEQINDYMEHAFANVDCNLNQIISNNNFGDVDIFKQIQKKQP